jgi:hypothetical protein
MPSRPLLSYAPAFLALVLVACSDETKPAATKTATAFPSATIGTSATLTAPRPAPAPTAPLTITWQPAELLQYTGEEVNNVSNYLNKDPAELRWQVLTGSLGGQPALLYETRRWLQGLIWDAENDRITTQFAAAVPPSVAQSVQTPCPQPSAPPALPPSLPACPPGTPGPPSWPAVGVQGLLSFDPQKPGQPEQEARFLNFNATPAPDGHTFLLRQGSIFAGRGDVYLFDMQTQNAGKLAGFNVGEVAYPVWSPDSRYIQLKDRAGAAHLLPVVNGPAIPVVRPLVSTGAWSSEPRPRFAYLDRGMAWVIDPRIGDRRSLGTVPVNQNGYAALSWLAGTNKIEVEAALVDADSGAVRNYPRPADPLAAVSFAVSPDERYLLTAESPLQSFPDTGVRCPPVANPEPPDAPQTRQRVQNRIYLYDGASDSTRTLKECDGREFQIFQWLSDSRHVVMTGFDCYACEPYGSTIILEDVESGQETTLTNAIEPFAASILSPDGKKVLVTGDYLRVYSQTGEVLQRLSVPPGFSVVGAVWAPDSQRFAYIVGPRGRLGV